MGNIRWAQTHYLILYPCHRKTPTYQPESQTWCVAYQLIACNESRCSAVFSSSNPSPVICSLSYLVRESFRVLTLDLSAVVTQ